MTALRRTAPVAAAIALAASAYMCGQSRDGTGGAGGNGHLLDGGAGASSGGAGGAAAGGSGGGAATGGSSGTPASDAGPAGIFPCASLPPSSEPVPTGWPAGAKRLPALDPDVYVFEVPSDPTPLTWKACGTGCRELVNTWAPGLSDGLWGDTIGGAAGNAPWVMLRLRLPDRIETWIGPADGAAVHMLAEQIPQGGVTHGFSGPLGIGASGFVIDAYLHESSAWALGATLNGPLRCMFEERNPGGMTQVLDSLATSTNRWALWPQGNGPGWSGKLPIGSAAAPVPTAVPLPAGYLRGEGFVGLPEGFVMSGYQPVTTALFVWTPATGTVPFVAAPPPDETDYPAATDGDRVAWLRGSGLATEGGHATWSKVELMMATESGQFPVTGNSMGVLPTFQPWTSPSLKSGLRGDYFAGWLQQGWPHPDSLTREFVPFLLRLSDRRIWIIPPRTADVEWENVLYLSDSEIALLEKTRKTYVGYAHTVVRYRLDSLGPGQALADALDAGVP